MNGFRQYTPVRIALPFIVGITLGLHVSSSFSFLWLIWIELALLAGLILFHLVLVESYAIRWLPGAVAGLMLFLSGFSMVVMVKEKNRPSVNEIQILQNAKVFLCRMESGPVSNANGLTLKAKLLKIQDTLSEWQPFSRLLVINCKADTVTSLLRAGDIFIVKGSLMAIPGPANPHAFDYRKYLQNQQIHYRVFAEPGSCLYLETGRAGFVKRWAEKTRDEFLDVFRGFGIDGQEFALAAALLFGTRDFLENETEQEFSNAGAVHVLSVSGLHVGIMYVVADKIFFFLKRGRKSKRLHQALIILLIWAYSFISGLPSSVVRASMMFSLIAAGKMLKRHPENFNILAIAALIQLWINPFELTNLGFQLSYLAVAGIFAFYTPLNDSIGEVNRPVEWVWSVISVSIAAQLVTFPLASYHFHMFPVYFLVTNLLVVPLAAIVTYFAVFLLFMGSLGFYFPVLSLPFDWSLRFMMDSVAYIQSWPGAVIDSIKFTLVQMVLLYAFIAGLFCMFVLKSRKFVFLLLICVLVYSCTLIFQRIVHYNDSYLTVYKTKGFSAIDLSASGTTIFISDKPSAEVQQQIDYYVKPNRVSLGAVNVLPSGEANKHQIPSIGYFRNGPFIFFRDKRILILDSNWSLKRAGHLPGTDLLIITGNPRFSLKDMGLVIGIKQVVIGSTVPYFKAGNYHRECQELGIPCHSVHENGAFVMKW